MRVHFSTIPEQPVAYIVAGLIIIVLLVLVLPFRIRKLEENLEPFFLLMGILAVSISSLWSIDLVIEALKAPVMIGNIPIGIFQAVLVFGVLLFFFNQPFFRIISRLVEKLSLRNFIFLMIVVIGLLSSLVSVIVTAVLLSEIVAALPLKRPDKIKLVIITCFAVGLGAVLTPLGEPLSTILVQKLAGEPYNAGFTWPIGHFSIYVIPGVVALAVFGAVWLGKNGLPEIEHQEYRAPERLSGVIIRAVKVFIFVAALILLGEGLRPLVVWYLIDVPAFALYWINSISAVLDNATLTAVEATASMSISQIISLVMALLIAGGMLIPGNIPNIVAAGRLKISMKEWAKTGLLIGLILLVIYFLALLPIIFE
jgi:predicted cation transporter